MAGSFLILIYKYKNLNFKIRDKIYFVSFIIFNLYIFYEVPCDYIIVLIFCLINIFYINKQLHQNSKCHIFLLSRNTDLHDAAVSSHEGGIASLAPDAESTGVTTVGLLSGDLPSDQ